MVLGTTVARRSAMRLRRRFLGHCVQRFAEAGGGFAGGGGYRDCGELLARRQRGEERGDGVGFAGAGASCDNCHTGGEGEKRRLVLAGARGEEICEHLQGDLAALPPRVHLRCTRPSRWEGERSGRALI